MKKDPEVLDGSAAQMTNLNDSEQFLMTVVEAVESAMKAGNVSVAQIAKDLHLTEQSFRRRLYKFTGKTPKAYFAGLQMKHAAKILTESIDIPIAKVAKMCGFENNSSFGHKFKLIYGCAPSHFREMEVLKQHRKTIL